MPPMVGGIFYEHGHRMIAGVVGIMIMALAIWVARREPRRWVRRLGWIAFGGVVVQALLGGLTVVLLLPPPVSIAHAVLGQGVFCLTALMAWVTSAAWPARSEPVPDPHRPSTRSLARMVAWLAVGQLLLGAVIRHTGHAVAEHATLAVLLLSLSLWAGRRVWRRRHDQPAASMMALRLLILLAVQVSLGVSVFFHRGWLPARTAHLLIGALVLAQSVQLAWEASRRFAPPVRRSGLEWLRLWAELSKARLAMLVVFSTTVGYWMAMTAAQGFGRLGWVCLGTALVVAGANALNQWLEREPDARMVRTQARPIPSGRLSAPAACRIGWALSVAGILVLATMVNLLSAVIATVSWISYVLVYTPLKRRTPLCTLVGAVPGALPPVIGWAGARNSLSVEAWVIFGILFLWQLPHFLAIAVLYRDDYARAGFPMLPTVEPDGLMTARQTVLYGSALLPISLIPSVVGLSGSVYFCGAFLLGGAFLAIAVRAAWLRSTDSARQLFHASIIYLPVLLTLLAVDRVHA
jgi:protoheme IX farnesyltransferase